MNQDWNRQSYLIEQVPSHYLTQGRPYVIMHISNIMLQGVNVVKDMQ